MNEMSRKRDQKMTWMEMFKAVKTRKKEEKVVRVKGERERELCWMNLMNLMMSHGV